MTKAMTIGQISKNTNVGIETIRFYERKGLIDNPPRLESGYRQYPENTIERIRFIKLAKELGFSLKDIGELLALKVNRLASCGSIKVKAESKLAEIESKIHDLQKMANSLKKLSINCDQGKKTNECPILEALH